jgi:transcriptional regulator with XRE-family HTH domain
MTSTETPKSIHHGRNVKRFREMLGIKQEALAEQLGGDWSQKKISLLESKEVIENELLNELAKALKLPAESFKNFSEDAALNIISNTFTSQDTSTLNAINYYPTFNPFDKLIEMQEKNEKLYEALLKSEREKVALLEKLLRQR